MFTLTTSKAPIISVLLFLALCYVQNSFQAAQNRDSRQEEGCHLRELDLCLAPIAVFTQNNDDRPVTNLELNRQCKILTEIEGCLTNFTSRCMTEQQSRLFQMMAEGGLTTIKELCKSKSKVRESYLKHGDCINGLGKEQRVCLRDFQASLEKAADIEWQDRLKLACCSFNRLNACTRDILEPKCGHDALELHKTLFRASFSRLPSITCSKYEHNSKSCAALLPPAGTIPKGSKSHSVLSKLFSSYTAGN